MDAVAPSAAPADSVAPAPGEVVETLVSRVVLTRDLALKAKKDLRLPFIDLSTPARRRRACQEEVRLNRRLAPDVYLGVGSLRLPGRQPEPLVVMKRLPKSLSLAALAQRGDHRLSDCLDGLAGLLARFHRDTTEADHPGAVAGAAAVGRLWDTSLEELDRFSGRGLASSTLGRVRRWSQRYLHGCPDAFENRVASRRIRDGHGDLLASDVFCLDDGPRVLDCLEFDRRLRLGDVLSDVACLTMDLERLGRPDLGAFFLERYRAAADDDWPDSLAHHWIAYRALVRTKVGVLRAEQAGLLPGAAERRLLALAQRHLEAARPSLVLIGGPPASGKSTLARSLSERRSWALLSSDTVRQELRLAEADRYTDQGRGSVYRELEERASDLLAGGRSVVVDATWARAAWRRGAARVAAAAGARLVPLRCSAPAAGLEARMAARRGRAFGSEASPEVARRLAEDFEPWPQARVLDTLGRPAEVVAAALSDLDPRRWPRGDGGRPSAACGRPALGGPSTGPPGPGSRPRRHPGAQPAPGSGRARPPGAARRPAG